MNQIKWFQDQEFIWIEFYFPNSLQKNIQVITYTNFVQIYDQSNKKLERIDFFKDVLLEENTKFVYQDQWVKIKFIKKEKLIWDDYYLTIDKQQIKERRKNAILERQQFLNQLNQEKLDKKLELEKIAQNQKFEKDKILRKQKQDQLDQQKNQQINDIIDQDYEENIDNNLLSLKEKNFIQKKTNFVQQNFEIRNSNKNIQLKFKEKIHPNLAMREKYIFEPPALQKQKKNSFLWIHDKGNQFLKNKDYISAMQAYEEVLKVEPKYLPTIANKSLIFLKQNDLQQSLEYCEKFLQILNEGDSNTKALKKYIQMKEIIQKRKIYIYLHKGKSDQALNLLKQLRNDNQENQNIQKDIELLEQRINSLKQKSNIDKKMPSQQYELIEQEYKEFLKQYPDNEKVLSNLSLVLMKQNKYIEALDIIEQILSLMEYFSKGIDIQNSYETKFKEFVLKLLMRKVKCEENLNQQESLNKTIKMIAYIDPNNIFSNQYRKNQQYQKQRKEYFETKENFINLIKEQNYEKALKMIQESQKLLEQDFDYIEILGIGLNKSMIFEKLKQFTNVISECSKGLRKISALKTNILDKKKLLLLKQEKEKIQKMEILFYFRRANGYFEQQMITHGKEDINEILKLQPENQEAKRILNEIN